MEGLSHTPEESSAIASRLFVKASVRYPASVAVQGEATALGCLEACLPAKVLGESLLSDTAQLASVRQIANNAHRHINVEVSTLALRHIIGSVFAVAQGMQEQWKPQRLRDITAMYPSLKDDPFAAHALNRAVAEELGVKLATGF